MKKVADNNNITKKANNIISQQMADASSKLDFAENIKILPILFDSIDTAICVTDEHGYFIDLNNAYSILSGYKKDELIGNKYSMIAVALPETTDLPITNGGHSIIKIQHKNGLLLQLTVTTALLPHTNGKQYIATSVKGTNQNIAASSELLQLRLLIDNTEESFIVIDKGLAIIGFNKQFEKEFHRLASTDILVGQSILTYTPDDIKASAKIIFENVFKGETAYTEAVVNSKNGEALIIACKFKPVKDETGNITGAFISCTDITDKKKIKRLLTLSEKRYKAIIENGSNAITILSKKAKVTYASAAIYAVLGYTGLEALAIDFLSLVHTDDVVAMAVAWQYILVAPQDTVYIQICRMRHKDGSWHWIENTLSNLLGDAAIQGILNSIKDVSESIATSEKIKQSEENLQAIFENTSEGFILIDTDFTIKLFNNKVRDNTFLPKKIHIGSNILDAIEEPRKPIFKGILEKACLGEAAHYERPGINKITQEQIWIDIFILPVRVGKKVTAICITARNITKQKASEKQITQTQNLLNRAGNIAQTGSAVINIYTNKRIWSDEFYRIVGLEPRSIIPSEEGIIQFLHPDEKDAYVQWLKKGIANKVEFQQMETRIISQDGKVKNIMAYGSTTYNADGKPDILIGVIQDITGRKNIEQELQFSKEIYQSLFYQNPAAVFSLDMEGNFTSANHILALRTGYPPEKLLQLHFKYFLHPDDIKHVNECFENSKQGLTQENTARIISKEGLLINVSLVSLPIVINQKIVGVYCIANDITIEINARINLSNMLADRQRILDYSLDVICELDKEGKFIQVSKACETMWGYGQEELIGTHCTDMVVKDDKDVSLKMFAIIASGGRATRNFENRYRKKKGGIINLIWSMRWDEKDKTMYCIAKDGSEKKEQQQALVLSERRYRDLFDNNPLPLYIFDFFTHYILEANKAALVKYGYRKEELLWLTIIDLLLPEDVMAFEGLLQDETTFNKASNKIWKHKKKNGEIMHMQISGNSIDYKGTNCVLALLEDVTEKIKAEKQKEFERIEKEALINSTDDLIWSVSKDFKLIAGNKAFIKTIGDYSGTVFKPGDYLLNKNNFSAELIILWQEIYSRALNGHSFKNEMTYNYPGINIPQWNEVIFNPIYNGKDITGIACFSRNITESKLYHNELININKKLETAQQMARLGYWEVDILKDTCYWSNELYRIFGIKKTSNSIPFQDIINAIHPDDKKMAINNYKLAINGKKALNHEVRIFLKDGSIKVLHQKGALVYHQDGHPILLEGTTQDITRQKLSEKAIKESEEKYRMIFNSSPLPNWIYDLETLQVQEVNNAAIAHYGYTNSQFLGMSIVSLFIKEQEAAIIKINTKISNDGIINFGQWQHVKKDGEIINVDITGHSIYYNNKNAVMIASNDITDILKGQQALALSNERFNYATKATFDAIWDYDLKTNKAFLGEGFQTLFGHKMYGEDVNISFIKGLIHDDDRLRVLNSLQEISDNKEQVYWKNQYRLKKADGSYTTVMDSAIVVRDEHKVPYRIIGAMQDISERIQNEAALKELNNQLHTRAEELVSSNAELEQFAYIASHDLQEPLRMVTSFLSQLQKKYQPQLDENGQLYIRFAVDGAVRMRKVIQALLEYSRVGTQHYRYEKIDTTSLLNDVINVYSNIMQQKNIIISYQGLPEIIAARIPIQQLFQNLISNAIKYQQPNNIAKIVISAIEQQDYWYFAVADNGIGIKEESLSKIFILFQRLHNDAEYSGSGIGLAICKKIIESHKGKLWVTSEPEVGSTFYFSIPKIPPSA